mmetsp:Transcript_104619/g.305433  ORF Transcript_104619/g.305433 Transcript_104619/m.305433 type:complete len:351 (+) Transcript_104619:222-1274(+)
MQMRLLQLPRADQRPLLRAEGELRAPGPGDALGVVLVRPVLGRHARLHALPALPETVQAAPSGGRHADVGHSAYQVTASEKGAALPQGPRVAMHRPAVPEQQVASSGRDHGRPRPAVHEHGVRDVHAEVVLHSVHPGVSPQHVVVEAVGPRHHNEATRVLRGVLQRHQPLHAVQAALVVRLVQVEPVLLPRPPPAVVAVGPEDAGPVEGGDEVLGPPEVGEDPPQPRQAPQLPHRPRLAHAPAPDDAVVARGPAAAPDVRVLPGADVGAGDAAGGVRTLEEVPQQGIRLRHLPLVCHGRHNHEALVCQVAHPAGHVLWCEAVRLQGPGDGHARQRPVRVQEAVDVAQRLG